MYAFCSLACRQHHLHEMYARHKNQPDNRRFSVLTSKVQGWNTARLRAKYCSAAV
jgi:hypothetical protein